MTTIAKGSRLARDLEVPELAQNVDVKVKASAIRTMRKTLPPAVIMFEIWNLNSAVDAWEKSRELQQGENNAAADIFNGLSDLAFATMEAIIRFTEESSKLHTFLKEKAFTLFGRNIGLAPFTGAVTGLFSLRALSA